MRSRGCSEPFGVRAAAEPDRQSRTGRAIGLGALWRSGNAPADGAAEPMRVYVSVYAIDGL